MELTWELGHAESALVYLGVNFVSQASFCAPSNFLCGVENCIGPVKETFKVFSLSTVMFPLSNGKINVTTLWWRAGSWMATSRN